jgi:S-adenosylmethionine synthetase
VQHHRELRLFTSESVTEGHPDKVADQISDAVLDTFLTRDPMARVACETLVTAGRAVIAGEATARSGPSRPELEAVVRRTIRRIGYTGRNDDFDADTVDVQVHMGRQTADIAMGVDTGGAGDQGMMFGFACDETPELMPLPIMLAHRITRRLTEARTNGDIPYLGPDGKAQVTVAYDGDGSPQSVPTVVASSQHAEHATGRVARDIEEHVVLPVLPEAFRTGPPAILVNPTGKFVEGGPAADCGLTGRKIIVDTYGGMARHGGGAFSGKDATKVDRSAAYMARYIAKNVVAAELARRTEVQIAYAIGRAEPVSVRVDTFGTGQAPDTAIERGAREVFGLTPKEIIAHFDLRRPIYENTAKGGHFGHEGPGFPWENTDRAEALVAAVGR